MKVTVTCEECGAEILSGGGYEDAEHIARRFSAQTMLPKLDCPNCAKLRYGPLTVEMVAEAMWEAGPGIEGGSWDSAGQFARDMCRERARFVLRLLQTWDATAEIQRRECYADDWHAKLLELAKEK